MILNSRKSIQLSEIPRVLSYGIAAIIFVFYFKHHSRDLSGALETQALCGCAKFMRHGNSSLLIF